jgi:hypothetical protein
MSVHRFDGTVVVVTRFNELAGWPGIIDGDRDRAVGRAAFNLNEFFGSKGRFRCERADHLPDDTNLGEECLLTYFPDGFDPGDGRANALPLNTLVP